MKKKIVEFTRLPVLIYGCLIFAVAVCDAQPSTRLVPRLKGYFSSPYGYWEYLPENYQRSKKYPVVIYLHGIKETGDGTSVAELDKVARNGVPHIIRKYQRNYPFILIAPQSPGVEEGFAAEGLKDFIHMVESRYNIDEDRIYLTGVSYGAYAVLRLASRMPDKFAAIVPFSSCGGENDLRKLKDVPMWAFANAMDKREVPECMEKLVDGIRDHGGTPLLTLYPRKGHNAWERTYKNDFMWAWLMKQKRVTANENQPPILVHPGNKSVGIGSLACYTIMASDANNDSLQFYIEGPVARGSRFKLHKNGHAELMLNSLYPGDFDVSVRVEDGRGGISRQTFSLSASYSMLFYPYLLLFILEPFLAEFPHSVLFLFLILLQIIAFRFTGLITRFLYWLSVLILATLGLQPIN